MWNKTWNKAVRMSISYLEDEQCIVFHATPFTLYTFVQAKAGNAARIAAVKKRAANILGSTPNAVVRLGEQVEALQQQLEARPPQTPTSSKIYTT